MPIADDFIVNAWHELGRCLSGGYGELPLTFTEIKAYSDSANTLTSFEVSEIARMSRDYINEKAASTAEVARDCEIKSIEDYEKIRNFKRKEVSNKMRQFASQAQEKAR